MTLSTVRYKFRSAILLVGGCLLLSACSEIGTQPPELWSARFTEDGSRLVYTYDEVFIWSYERKGGSTTRMGSSSYFLDVRDTRTGRTLFAKPLELSYATQIVDINADLCAVMIHNHKTSRSELSIVDLRDGTEKFNGEDLSRINGGLQFNGGEYFGSIPGRVGFIFAGEDARTYFIDGNTGAAELVEAGPGKHPMLSRANPDNLGSGSEAMRFTSGARQKLEVQGRSSEADFIDPKLAGAITTVGEERTPVIFQGGSIILSRSSTAKDFSWLVSSLDTASMKLKWSATIANVPDVAPFYNAEPLFALDGKDLLVLTSTSLSRFDAATGRLNWTAQVP